MKIQTNNTQQPLFINHTVHTKSLLYESITVFHRIILGWIACYSFSILFLILAYCSFHYFHLILLFLIFTLSAILIPIFWFLLPYQSIHKIYKKKILFCINPILLKTFIFFKITLKFIIYVIILICNITTQNFPLSLILLI